MSTRNLDGKTVAVTGGAGLIGSFLVEDLLARSTKVVVIDDFSTGSRAHLDAVADRIELREGDLEKPGVAAQCLAGAQIVFHLASRAFGVGYGTKRHLEICLHNERVTNNVVEALAAKPPEFVLTVSSSCVHRDDGPDTFPELPVYDGEPERVNSGYGWAKRFMETKFMMLSEVAGIPVAIARPVNIYGERYRWRGANSQAIPMLVHKVMSGMDPVVIWGSGRQRRNYLHAQDCAVLLRRLVEADAGGQTVNIGLENTVSMAELVALIVDVAGSKAKTVLDTSKPEGRFVKSADSTRLRALLGTLEPTIDLREGIARMVEWFAHLPTQDRLPMQPS
jgi:nucleoside-diphosphate-sugar epimerase